MARLPSTVRAVQLAAAFAQLDAIENAAELSNDRLAGLADTTSSRVKLWRRERGILQPPRIWRRTKVRGGIEPSIPDFQSNA